MLTKYAHAINQPKISSGHKVTQNDLKPRIVLEWLLSKYDWTYTIEKPIEIRFEIWVFSPFCFFTKPYIEYWPTHITHNIRTISITWTFTWEIMSWLFRVLIMLFVIGIRSMQGWTATKKHGVTTKRSTKRLKHTENLFRKNLQLTGVC